METESYTRQLHPAQDADALKRQAKAAGLRDFEISMLISHYQLYGWEPAQRMMAYLKTRRVRFEASASQRQSLKNLPAASPATGVRKSMLSERARIALIMLTIPCLAWGLIVLLDTWGGAGW